MIWVYMNRDVKIKGAQLPVTTHVWTADSGVTYWIKLTKDDERQVECISGVVPSFLWQYGLWDGREACATHEKLGDVWEEV